MARLRDPGESQRPEQVLLGQNRQADYIWLALGHLGKSLPEEGVQHRIVQFNSLLNVGQQQPPVVADQRLVDAIEALRGADVFVVPMVVNRRLTELLPDGFAAAIRDEDARAYLAK